MRKALIVGVDTYPPPSRSLTGCVNDAKRLTEILESNYDGSPNFDCQTMLAGPDEVTQASLLNSIDELFRHKAEFALFHFSGHGTINNLGGYLVTQDTQAYREGVRMTDVLDLANNSPVEEVLILLDCCHAGAFGDPPRVDNTIELREGVSVLTASRDSQVAMEENEAGVFASLISDALLGGAADVLGRVTVGSLYAYVDQALGGWDQRPLFKAHVARFKPVRTCAPVIEPKVLRSLPQYFKASDTTKKLDPSYEPTQKPRNAEHEAIFADLQKMRAAGLVEPISEGHLYFEAVNKGGCKLTPLGRYYWKLAKAKRF